MSVSDNLRVSSSSDWHGDAVTVGVRRFDEISESAHKWADSAIEEGVDVACFLGDLTDPDSGSCTFRVVRLAIEIALKFRARGVSSIWLAGNHDTVEDGSGDTTLTPLRALEVLNDDRVEIQVAERPTAFEFAPRASSRAVRFVCLPFTATSHAYEVDAAIIDLCEGSPKEDTVILSHLHVMGVESGEESTEMARGREVTLPVALAMEKAAVVLQGHYHRQQRTKDGVWIAGSLARLTFAPGIEHHRPGFLSVSV